MCENNELGFKMILGYTTGVFDLFHIGHLNIIKSAKSHCDYLIVGITTDELAQKRKGKKPIIPFHERFEIIRAIKYVDRTVVQDTMDKFIAWEKYHFDKMFVGSDWKGTEKWNKLEIQFKNIGVEIVYFTYTQNTSSTLIRKVLEETAAGYEVGKDNL
jgi:glycerol-3-phosphate cytidylyltransferase